MRQRAEHLHPLRLHSSPFSCPPPRTVLKSHDSSWSKGGVAADSSTREGTCAGATAASLGKKGSSEVAEPREEQRKELRPLP